MKKLSIIICLYLISVAEIKTQITTLHIDPDNAMSGTVSHIFESGRYIPLETTKVSSFGKIYQLKITDKYFIITDLDTRAIL